MIIPFDMFKQKKQKKSYQSLDLDNEIYLSLKIQTRGEILESWSFVSKDIVILAFANEIFQSVPTTYSWNFCSYTIFATLWPLFRAPLTYIKQSSYKQITNHRLGHILKRYIDDSRLIHFFPTMNILRKMDENVR